MPLSLCVQYTLNGVYEAANALTIDSVTKKPIEIRNDNGMEGIFVYGFDTQRGQQLYIDAVKNLTSTGLVYVYSFRAPSTASTTPSRSPALAPARRAANLTLLLTVWLGAVQRRIFW